MTRCGFSLISVLCVLSVRGYFVSLSRIIKEKFFILFLCVRIYILDASSLLALSVFQFISSLFSLSYILMKVNF